MKAPSERLLKRLALAVWLRSNRATWESVAARVRSRPEVCCRWPKRYPEEWRRYSHLVTARLLELAEAEAVTVLQQLANNPDEKVSKKANRLLRKFREREG